MKPPIVTVKGISPISKQVEYNLHNDGCSFLSVCSTVVCHASIRLDDPRCKVYKNGREIEMTHMEYELLKLLMNHPGITYSRDALLEKVWRNKHLKRTRTVDVHIRRLRIKIEDDDKTPQIIETVRGRGYRLAALK